jgi:hypothetical protein
MADIEESCFARVSKSLLQSIGNSRKVRGIFDRIEMITS